MAGIRPCRDHANRLPSYWIAAAGCASKWNPCCWRAKACFLCALRGGGAPLLWIDAALKHGTLGDELGFLVKCIALT